MYIYERSYIHGKDAETKIEIPTPTPAASVCQTPHNSTEAQNRKTGITNITLVKGHYADKPAASRTARFTNKMQTN